MLKVSRELNFPPESLGVDLGGQLGRQHLDDDTPAKLPLLGDEDAAHPSAAQLALELVGIA